MAARLISRDQPLVKGIYYPRGVYSRVVCLHVGVLAGVGMGSFAFTPVVASRTWLLSVDMWLQPRALTDVISGYIWLRTGLAKEPTYGVIVFDWSSVVDLSTTAKNAFYYVGGVQHWRFEMNQLFTGSPRRFGIAVANGVDVMWDLQASFTVSES